MNHQFPFHHIPIFDEWTGQQHGMRSLSETFTYVWLPQLDTELKTIGSLSPPPQGHVQQFKIQRMQMMQTGSVV